MSRSPIAAMISAVLIAAALPVAVAQADETLDALRRDAYAGDAMSQRLYAIMLSYYYAEDDDEIDEYEAEKIVRWFECAALQGDEIAIEHMQNVPFNFDISETGECEYTGAGYTADDPKPDPLAPPATPDTDRIVKEHADIWDAASDGYPDAQFKLGEHFEPSLFDPGNMNLAEIWYNCAARQGYQKAIDRLKDDPILTLYPASKPCPFTDKMRDENGNLYFQSPIEQADASHTNPADTSGNSTVTAPQSAPTPALETATATATNTTSEVEEIYGAAHDAFYGTDRDQSYEDALTFARKAADLGHAGAINLLGVIYHNGLGVPQDLTEAAYHFRRAAELGEVVAMTNIADCYLHGTGVEVSLPKAVEWYEKAAVGGNAGAQYNLAAIYQSGGGDIKADPVLARHWMGLAAQNGDPDAPYYYGNFLEYGIGGPEDPAAAVPWYQRAVELGSIDGYAAMGRMHYYGEHAPEDLERAWLYLAIAEDGGHPDAREWRETIEPYVSFEERSRAIVELTKYRAQKAETAN
ncbi:MULTISPECIES: tetratricopeptide repeat protein [Thalassospira]|uniref:Tetratricopeptide repeat protein n=1 Tax=Thalassospira aquimaris TaxID=3037796 RepID=A0ABT6G860_9PROT|nr:MULTISPECIES: tetratricopeptide repeat protein [Thalassospira]MDG4718082.1 tetratricopeptide repeat protein [Thalassospira sp. FZY0004]